MSGDHNLSYGVCALGYALFRSLAALPRQKGETQSIMKLILKLLIT